jgi:hypothetical protein
MNLISVLGIRYIGVRIIVVFAARKLERQQLVSWPRNSSGHNCFSKDSASVARLNFRTPGARRLCWLHPAPSGRELTKNIAALRAAPKSESGAGHVPSYALGPRETRDPEA